MTEGSGDAMSKTLDFLALHWLSLLLLAAALLPLLGLRRRRTAGLLAVGGLALFALGELTLPLMPWWLPWVVGGAGLLLLLGLVAMLLLTGEWLRPLVPAAGALVAFA